MTTGLRHARRHPRAALKLTSQAARHPRRTRRLVRVARVGGSYAPTSERAALAEVLSGLRAATIAYRKEAAKARRRARMRRVAVGASVVGVAALAERSRRAAT
jgi:hypothetical protein